MLRTEAGRDAVGLAPDERFVGVIYLGRPCSDPPAKERAPLDELGRYLP